MILKIQQESSISQPDEQERFTAYLIDKLKPKDSEEFELMVSSYTEKELKELYKQFTAMEGTLFAKMGAKLDYLTKLNGKCPEGYEIEKFMAGGCAKCKKKAKALMFDLGGSPKRIQNDSDTIRATQQKAQLATITNKETRLNVADANRKVMQDKANEKARQAYQQRMLLRKCGGKTKKRISKNENGAAFRKVNGGPGSVDSTRDMKPNKKQRKMIKKHLYGGITLPTALNAETRYLGGKKTWVGMPSKVGSNIYFDKSVEEPIGLTSIQGNDGSFWKYPSKITLFISSNPQTNKLDTIYTELPSYTRFNPLQIQHLRTASSVVPNLEYLTMKRRFNTANNVVSQSKNTAYK